jgi:DNA invertase Pin-like site-specific DNA recombinase
VQKKRSIKAQIEYCQRFLTELGVVDCRIRTLADEGLSGELRSRPGIDQVWAGVKARAWDLVLVEDASRLYRDEVACLDLIRLAVDQEIRTISINDRFDTNEEGWEERLKDVAQHHARNNHYVSYRVKRAHEELWEEGAAIGLLKPGYRRVPSVPASEDGPEEGPYFDEVDPRWTPKIKEAYERIAAGESPWSVADWLTAIGFPKAANCHSTRWTDKNVVALITREDHRGWQVYRDCISKKEYSSGRHKAKPNDPDKVLSREMPHLRIVEDWLWYAANAAIQARAHAWESPRGKDHPLYGIPRESRGPLSGVLVCGCCGAKMRVDGRIEGGYRCAQVRSGGCWNRTTALRDKTHQWLSQAIATKLQTLGPSLDRLRNDAAQLLEDDGKRESRIVRLKQKKTKLEAVRERLLHAIEHGKQTSETLVARLETHEERWERVCAKLERLKRKEKLCLPPTREEIADRVGQILDSLAKMDRSSRDPLKTLVGTIRAVPCQQFGGNKVVLRAKFELHLAALLPPRTRVALGALGGSQSHEPFETIPMVVDLFEPSTGPKHGLAALSLREEQHLGLTAIGKQLDISKRQAHIAVEYGKTLREAGLVDPFVELTKAPQAASRWHTRKSAMDPQVQPMESPPTPA